MKSETIKVRIDRNGNVRRVVGNVGQTRMNRAAAALWHGDIEPTFGYKLRRFVKRAVLTFNAKMDEAAAIAYGTDVPASDVPYIGLLEEQSMV